jgi:Sporulation and spore germination
VGVLALLPGCGVPTGGPAETIPGGEVPYGLTSAAPTPGPSAGSEPTLHATRVHLVAPDDHLVPEPREVDGNSVTARLEALLDDLARGPTPGELERQLSTALPPEIELDVAEVSDGTAVVRMGDTTAATGPDSRRAVAQIVLTATSVTGVDSVVLVRDGERVEAPLPSGELTAQPLTADDYAALLLSPAVPAAPPT